MYRTTLYALLLLALLAGGCLPDPFELKQHITLNPDGSGKAKFDLHIVCSPQEADVPGLEKAVHKAAQDFVAGCSGVDAFADLRYELSKDARVHITGTIYFKDLSDFTLGSDVVPAGKWVKTEDGGRMLSALESPVFGDDCGHDPPTRPAREGKPTDREIASELLAARMVSQQGRPLFVGLAAAASFDVTYHLPGKLRRLGAFRQAGPGQVRLAFGGQETVKRFDSFLKTGKLPARPVWARKKPLRSGELTTLLYFGKAGRPEVTVAGPFRPLFDYQAEVRKAKQAMPAMFKKLRIDPEAEPSSRPSETTGIRLSFPMFSPTTRPAKQADPPAPGKRP